MSKQSALLKKYKEDPRKLSSKQKDELITEYAPLIKYIAQKIALLANEALRSIPVIVLSACEITLEEHRRIVDSGYLFCPKGSSSPREIAQHLKELVR